MVLETEASYLANIKNLGAKNFQGLALSIWHKLPVTRRSSVFILLFLGHLGELRVILTKRSSKLRSFPGHISFPGGNADDSLETEWQVSRREMHEEIGLHSDNEVLRNNYGFTIDHLNVMPCYLSRTFSAVRPCVGFMNFSKSISEADLIHNLKINLNPGESSSVFSCPLRDFLYPAEKTTPIESLDRSSYKIEWGGIPWNLRSYTFLQTNHNEVSWLKDILDLSQTDEECDKDERAKEMVTPPPEEHDDHHVESREDMKSSDHHVETSENVKSSDHHVETRENVESPDHLNGTNSTTNVSPTVAHSSHKVAPHTYKSKRPKKDLSKWGRLGSRRHSATNEKIYDVWGLTANILHDLAEIIYRGPTEREIGEEELIYSVWHHGHQMKEKKRSDEEVKLINASLKSEYGFGDILPRSEFVKLRGIYKL
jgi:8-oxo-dGTP pyrophosphatase MutT (NUDIX family)